MQHFVDLFSTFSQGVGMDTRKRGRPRMGGSREGRSETVTIRMSPRIKYLVDIAARAERRTVSSILEWCFEEALASHTAKRPIMVPAYAGMEIDLFETAAVLWDVDEADRFARLALYAPTLLNYDEAVLWKRIWEHEGFWHRDLQVRRTLTDPAELLAALDLVALRAQWDLLQQVAAGEADPRLLSQPREGTASPPAAADLPVPRPVAVRRAPRQA
jgi:hypothetical protein